MPMTGRAFRFGVLGPLVLERDGFPVTIPRGRQRALLAMLLAAAGTPLSRDRLIDDLWGDRAPANAVTTLHVHLSKLRLLLGDLLVLESGGYTLASAAYELDVWRFSALVEQARTDPEQARALLSEALGLVRGEPLCDVPAEGSVERWRQALTEKWLEAVALRVDADLAAGASRELIAELEQLCGEHPYEERFWGQLMLALYRAGRQADALEAYRRIRTQLAEELGLDPGPALQSLHQQILEHAPSLDGRSVGGDRVVGGSTRSDRAALHLLRLPSLASATIGREDALEDLVGLLGRQDVRIVTLTGPGGVGKTRLALLAAHTAAASCADGAVWIELAGVARAEEVASTIMGGLGVTPGGGETAERAVCRHLVTRELLLVLDNFEHVIDSAGLVSELHRTCPQLNVLVTSRQPLDLSAEHCYAVAPLELPDRDRVLTVEDVERTPSTAMFLAAARRRNHHFALAPADVPAIARICTRLEGLPLALELAAARTGTLGLGQLAADLDTQLDGLGPGPRDAPARHRTLEATIEWSFVLLSPDLQTVFARFAVFAGGATLDAAQTIIGASSDAFGALVTKNMIATRSGAGRGKRLVMLETLRQYAGRKLDRDPNEPELRRRHLEHYLTMAEAAVAQLATRDERGALEALDSELENLHAAREWALQHDPNLCLRITGHLGAYWGLRRNPAALDWCDAALRAAGDGAPVLDRARVEYHRARQLAFGNQYDASIAAASRALALYTQTDDHAGIARALCSLALDTGMLTGDLEQERRYAKSAVRHARASGDDIVLAKALSELAGCAEPDERGPLVEQAAGIFKRLGDDSGLARLYNNCAYIALTEGRVQEARELLENGLNLPRSGTTLHLPALLSNLLSNLGLARLLAGDPHAARHAFAQALEVTLTGYGDAHGESFAGLAAIAAIDGEDQVAACLHGASRTAGYPPSESDRSIDQRLTSDYLTAAQDRLGPAGWQRAEATGMTWTEVEAFEHAMTWASEGTVAKTDVVAEPRPVSRTGTGH